MKEVILKLGVDGKIFRLCGSEQDSSILGLIDKTKGSYEPYLINMLRNVVTADSICVDIGANIGAISLPLSYLASKGTVYAFEPSTANYDFLVKNVYVNNINNIKTINKGVYNEKIDLNFVEIGNGGGWSHVHNGKSPHQPNGVVSCVRLDDWVKDNNISKINLIKMDIEGSEYRALQGSVHTIKKLKPDLIIEFNQVAFKNIAGEDPEQSYSLLTSLYPQIYSIERDNSLVKIDSYSQLLELTSVLHRDLYCTFGEL